MPWDTHRVMERTMSVSRSMWQAAATFFAAMMVASTASALTPEELIARTAQRRAVDAAIWGQPIVSFDAMRQAYFRDARAKYNDVTLRANDGETSESLKFSLEGEGQPSWSCNTRKLIPTVLPGLVVTGDRA